MEGVDGKGAQVQKTTGVPAWQMTLDDYATSETCKTNSSGWVGDDHRMCMRGNRVSKGAKGKCRAERIREWELRGGKRMPKLFHGKGGWQLHIMPAGGREERVKAKQRDWSKPIPSTLIGVCSKEAAAHNTFENSYTFDGNDAPDDPLRDFQRVFTWAM